MSWTNWRRSGNELKSATDNYRDHENTSGHEDTKTRKRTRFHKTFRLMPSGKTTTLKLMSSPTQLGDAQVAEHLGIMDGMKALD